MRGESEDDRIPVGVSSCLLGEKVRYDGRHKLEALLLREEVGALVSFIPLCPETEAGLGVPREPMGLVSFDSGVRLLSESGLDCTTRLLGAVKDGIRRLRLGGFSGFVCKSKSPSCGLKTATVKVGGTGSFVPGRGLFTGALVAALPCLPIVEEEELRLRGLDSPFFLRIAAYYWVHRCCAGKGVTKALRAFHKEFASLILGDDSPAYEILGALLSPPSSKSRTLSDIPERYRTHFLEALAPLAPRSPDAPGAAPDLSISASLDGELRREPSGLPLQEVLTLHKNFHRLIFWKS